MIILGTNSIKGSGSYDVANSCRFNSGDSAYMHKTPGSAGTRTTWSLSMWVKRAKSTVDKEGDEKMELVKKGKKTNHMDVDAITAKAVSSTRCQNKFEELAEEDEDKCSGFARLARKL